MTTLHRIDIITEEDHVDKLTGLLYIHVSFGWEEESLLTGETRFRIYTDNTPLLEQITTAITSHIPTCRIELEDVPEKDWLAAWHEYFTPIEAGCFVVLPPWLAKTHNNKEYTPIIIEPKSAFGTGHHNTTVLCLQALSHFIKTQRITPNMRFFDIGTGTGILGIGAALYGLSGLLVDIDPIAIDNAKENTLINNVHKQCTIQTGSAQSNNEEHFDLVFANILAGPLKEMATDITASLKPKACLILSGLLTIQADDVAKAYQLLGEPQRFVDGEWTALVWN